MFSRLELLIQDKITDINNKSVLVIGLGGVGGYAVENLVRSGISNIEHVLRGYENIIQKLSNVGAKIELKEI